MGRPSGDLVEQRIDVTSEGVANHRQRAVFQDTRAAAGWIVSNQNGGSDGTSACEIAGSRRRAGWPAWKLESPTAEACVRVHAWVELGAEIEDEIDRRYGGGRIETRQR